MTHLRLVRYRPPTPRVVLARRVRGLSRGAVAEATGIDVARLREIDRGARATVAEMRSIAIVTEFPASFFSRPPITLLSGSTYGTFCTQDGCTQTFFA